MCSLGLWVSPPVSSCPWPLACLDRGQLWSWAQLGHRLGHSLPGLCAFSVKSGVMSLLCGRGHDQPCSPIPGAGLPRYQLQGPQPRPSSAIGPLWNVAEHSQTALTEPGVCARDLSSGGHPAAWVVGQGHLGHSRRRLEPGLGGLCHQP